MEPTHCPHQPVRRLADDNNALASSSVPWSPTANADGAVFFPLSFEAIMTISRVLRNDCLAESKSPGHSLAGVPKPRWTFGVFSKGQRRQVTTQTDALWSGTRAVTSSPLKEGKLLWAESRVSEHFPATRCPRVNPFNAAL